MNATSLTHDSAASLLPGARARFATSANNNRSTDLPPRFRASFFSTHSSSILGIKLPADAADQAFECLLVNPVLTAEPINHLRNRLAVHPLVMSELQVLHTVGLNRSQEHCAYTIPRQPPHTQDPCPSEVYLGYLSQIESR